MKMTDYHYISLVSGFFCIVQLMLTLTFEDFLDHLTENLPT